MLLLVFHAGPARYGLNASEVIEVIPAVSLRPLPLAGGEVAGLLNYHGAVVPVLDLNAVLTGERARLRLSSRIVIVDFPAADGARHPLGLLAERATETVPCREGDFQPAGIRTPGAPFMGDILIDGAGSIQKVEVARLLPPALQRRLFTASEAAGA